VVREAGRERAVRETLFEPRGVLHAVDLGVLEEHDGQLALRRLHDLDRPKQAVVWREEQRLADGSLAARFSYDSIRVTDPGSHDYSTPDDLVEPGAVGQGG
ncbi:MAG: hypothetical protein AAFU70_07145, partial [Planctomycetota bacterium]